MLGIGDGTVYYCDQLGISCLFYIAESKVNFLLTSLSDCNDLTLKDLQLPTPA